MTPRYTKVNLSLLLQCPTFCMYIDMDTRKGFSFVVMSNSRYNVSESMLELKEMYLARGWLFWLLSWFANRDITAASSVAKLKSVLSSFFLACSLHSFLWLKNSAMSANVVRHLPQRCKSSSWSSRDSSSSVNVIPTNRENLRKGWNLIRYRSRVS